MSEMGGRIPSQIGMHVQVTLIPAYRGNCALRIPHRLICSKKKSRLVLIIQVLVAALRSLKRFLITGADRLVQSFQTIFQTELH